ncbi:MFS transporter [Sphingomonas sp. AR_OL41]|uniref:MFS transporter n=1 Tax=Sphingomonas sp. AR_OL41 TaxID=3042729 RepID=UPI0024805EE3|nr:MFS transporter [Sphingomonas sp. AR_OL41]MDH7975207.1 MFS transporter [Sphingomonas sp. AR_OL41]
MNVAARTYRKVMRRVVLVLAGLIVLSSIDRVNVSFAAIRMNADIGLDAKGYGLGASLFFVGYLLCQIPSAALLRRIGARRWIAISVGGWGLTAAAMAFVTVPWEFFALRVLLGAFESGFAPGVVWYVSQWLPAEYRTRSIGLTLLAIPLSVMIGGPLCGALLKLDLGILSGWRLMFLVEGGVTVIAGLVALRWFVDAPHQARWLDDDERAWIAGNNAPLRADAKGAEPRTNLRDPVLWYAAAIWFALITGASAIIFWLPLAIKMTGENDPLVIGILSALPWVAIGAGMWLNARHSDRSGERFGHVAFPAMLAALGVGGAALVGGGAPALALLVVGGFGLGGAQSVFWSLPTRYLSQVTPQSIALINLCGNLGSAIAPAAIGWAIARMSLTAPILILAALLAAGALLVLPLRTTALLRSQDR